MDKVKAIFSFVSKAIRLDKSDVPGITYVLDQRDEISVTREEWVKVVSVLATGTPDNLVKLRLLFGEEVTASVFVKPKMTEGEPHIIFFIPEEGKLPDVSDYLYAVCKNAFREAFAALDASPYAKLGVGTGEIFKTDAVYHFGELVKRGDRWFYTITIPDPNALNWRTIGIELHPDVEELIRVNKMFADANSTLIPEAEPEV